MPAQQGLVAKLATDGNQALAALTQLHDAARGYIRASKATNTVRAYHRDWSAFEAWCRRHTLEPLPAGTETIVLYLTELAASGRKASTITRHAASISIAHQLAGHKPPPTQDPLVRDTLRGIRRTLGTARDAKAAVTLSILRRLVATCDPSTMAGIRDRALLLIGLASAMRRSELVSLDVGDLAEDEDGLTISLRRSKSDLEARGRKLAIPYGSNPETCPIRALRAWRRAAEIERGALWRPITRHGAIGADLGLPRNDRQQHYAAGATAPGRQASYSAGVRYASVECRRCRL